MYSVVLKCGCRLGGEKAKELWAKVEQAYDSLPDGLKFYGTPEYWSALAEYESHFLEVQ
jgi:hypothetical protein